MNCRKNDAMKRISKIRMVLAVFVAACLTSSTVQAYTPEDKVVRDMVNRGIAYIEGVKATEQGQLILLGYAHFKVKHDPDNAVVKAGIQAALKVADGDIEGHGENYEVAVAVLLLAAVNPERYRPQLTSLQRYFFQHQHVAGGWTYKGYKTGDVSQTQYALLAIWTLDRLGIPLDYVKVSKGIAWLLRVQDPSGCWPYQGADPGPGKPLMTQKRTTYSMALAGGSSALIGGDALRIWGNTLDDADPNIPGLPEAVKLYKEDLNAKKRKRGNIPKETVLRAIGAMDNYRAKQKFDLSTDFFYYTLYSLERYESFKEIAKGLKKDKSPAWYNQGVDLLRKNQEADGSWTKSQFKRLPPHVTTSFAMLFLIRSTQKSIVTVGNGAARGGYGFSDDLENAKLSNGSVKTKAIATEVTGLLDVLEKDGADDLGGKSLPEDLQLSSNPKERAAQLDRLERLVRGSSSWQARRVAARLLGKSDELRVVPALIFALSDNDGPVKRYARDGLRFISRKFEGFGMPDKPNYAELRQAQLNWRQWYKTIYPDYVFLDYDL